MQVSAKNSSHRFFLHDSNSMEIQLFAAWLLENISKYNFAHGMTALQNFLGVHSLEFRWEENEISTKFKLQEKNNS